MHSETWCDKLYDYLFICDICKVYTWELHVFKEDYIIDDVKKVCDRCFIKFDDILVNLKIFYHKQIAKKVRERIRKEVRLLTNLN